MRLKVSEQQKHWRDPEQIGERYFRPCERLHVCSQMYDPDLNKEAGALEMGFRKDAYRVGNQRERFGQTVIVTDNVE